MDTFDILHISQKFYNMFDIFTLFHRHFTKETCFVFTMDIHSMIKYAG